MMHAGDALSYFLTVVAIALAPGPVALVLIARSARRDVMGAVGFGLGFALGGLLITGAVCYGLATWLTAAPEVFEVGRYAMLAYILWIALGVWRGGFDLTAAGDAPRGGSGTRALASTGAGVATCLASPYMMILFPLVLPGMTDVGAIGSVHFATIAALTFAALMSGVAMIIVFAERIGRLARSARAMTILNRSLAGILVLAGGWLGLA